MGSPGFDSQRAPAQLGSDVLGTAGRAGRCLSCGTCPPAFTLGKAFSQSSRWNIHAVGKRATGGKRMMVQRDNLGAHTGSRSHAMCGVGKACSCAGLGEASRCCCLRASSIYGLKGQRRQGLPWLWESSSQETETWLQKAAVPQLCQAVGGCVEARRELESPWFSSQGLPGWLFCRLWWQMCQPASLPLCHKQSLQPSPTD